MVDKDHLNEEEAKPSKRLSKRVQESEKAAKKASVKKASPAKKEKKPETRKSEAKPKRVPVGEVKTVFSTTDTDDGTVEVPANSVLLFVNGVNKGTVDTTGTKLGAFSTAQAQRFGIRNYSLYLDGEIANTSMIGNSMEGISKIEIISKDSRA